MMKKVIEEIQINVPLERIWSIITDYNNITDWNPLHRDHSVSDSNIGIGSKSTYTVYRIVHSQGGDHYVSDRRASELIVLEKYKRLSSKMTDGLGTMKVFQTHLNLQADRNSTIISILAEYKVKLGLLGSILNKLVVSKQIKSELKEMMLNLKKFAESGEKLKFKKYTESGKPLSYIGKDKDISDFY